MICVGSLIASEQTLPTIPNPVSVSPNTGVVGAGTSVTITGTNFTGTTVVKIASSNFVSFTVVNDTTITGVLPSGSAGVKSVSVTNASGTGTLANAYTYTAASAPTLTSVSTSGGAVGDIAGGYPATLTGTNFTGATGVTFGGTAATSVVVVSSTSITCVVPAHATGAASVVVTTPGGSNGANTAFEYFSPAQLALSGWWKANYPGAAPWPGNASAGTSATYGGLGNNASDPTAGTAVNGKTPAHYDGVSNSLTTSTDVVTGGVWTTGAGTVVALVKPNAAVTYTGNVYDNPPVLVDGNADCGLSYSSIGFTMFKYDGAYKAAQKTAATGAYHAAMGRYDGTNVGITVDSGTEVTTAAGTSTVLTGSLLNGAYGTSKLAVDVLEVFTLPTYLSTANWAKVRSYFNTRYFPAGAQV